MPSGKPIMLPTTSNIKYMLCQYSFEMHSEKIEKSHQYIVLGAIYLRSQRPTYYLIRLGDWRYMRAYCVRRYFKCAVSKI